jgi:hypothetical protein
LISDSFEAAFGDWENSTEPIGDVEEKLQRLNSELMSRLIAGNHIALEKTPED